MRIIVATKQYGRFTGAAIATCELIKRWATFVERIDVICAESYYQPNCVPSARNVIVHPLKFYNPMAIRKEVKNLAIPGSILYSSDDYGIFGKLPDLPYVITNHSNWPGALVSSPRYFIAGLFHIPLYIINFILAQAVISVSYFGKRWASRFNRNCYVIRNGISLKITGARITLQHPNIMVVGSMDARKGALLAKIIDELKKFSENWFLYIIGNISHKPLLGRIDNERVFSLGYIDNVGDYLTECDVFILPSSMENLPLAVTEAMYMGKPVVCFDVGGLREIVSNRTGALINRYDTKQFAGAIINLLQNPEIRKQKGEQAQKIVQEFDWDKSATRYLEVFQDVLCNKSF